jgi:hypothetical protein
MITQLIYSLAPSDGRTIVMQQSNQEHSGRYRVGLCGVCGFCTCQHGLVPVLIAKTQSTQNVYPDEDDGDFWCH